MSHIDIFVELLTILICLDGGLYGNVYLYCLVPLLRKKIVVSVLAVFVLLIEFQMLEQYFIMLSARVCTTVIVVSVEFFYVIWVY